MAAPSATPTPLRVLADPLAYQVAPFRANLRQPGAAAAANDPYDGMPPPPPRAPVVKLVKDAMVPVAAVLPEDSFTAGLERIIERDFFPDLPKLQDQLEWLQAEDSKDPQRIAAARAKLSASVRRRDIFAAAPTPVGGSVVITQQHNGNVAVGGSRRVLAGDATPLIHAGATLGASDGAAGAAMDNSSRKRPAPADDRTGADDDAASVMSWSAGVGPYQRQLQRDDDRAPSAAADDVSRKRRRLSSSGFPFLPNHRHHHHVKAAEAEDILSGGHSSKANGNNSSGRSAAALRLDDFVAHFTSEDNASFGLNHAERVAQLKRRHWWLYEHALALPDGGGNDRWRLMLTDGNANRAAPAAGLITDAVNIEGVNPLANFGRGGLGGDPHGLSSTWTWRPRNGFFFQPSLAASSNISGVANPLANPDLQVIEQGGSSTSINISNNIGQPLLGNGSQRLLIGNGDGSSSSAADTSAGSGAAATSAATGAAEVVSFRGMDLIVSTRGISSSSGKPTSTISNSSGSIMSRNASALVASRAASLAAALSLPRVRSDGGLVQPAQLRRHETRLPNTMLRNQLDPFAAVEAEQSALAAAAAAAAATPMVAGYGFVTTPALDDGSVANVVQQQQHLMQPPPPPAATAAVRSSSSSGGGGATTIGNVDVPAMQLAQRFGDKVASTLSLQFAGNNFNSAAAATSSSSASSAAAVAAPPSGLLATDDPGDTHFPFQLRAHDARQSAAERITEAAAAKARERARSKIGGGGGGLTPSLSSGAPAAVASSSSSSSSATSAAAPAAGGQSASLLRHRPTPGGPLFPAATPALSAVLPLVAGGGGMHSKAANRLSGVSGAQSYIGTPALSTMTMRKKPSAAAAAGSVLSAASGRTSSSSSTGTSGRAQLKAAIASLPPAAKALVKQVAKEASSRGKGAPR